MIRWGSYPLPEGKKVGFLQAEFSLVSLRSCHLTVSPYRGLITSSFHFPNVIFQKNATYVHTYIHACTCMYVCIILIYMYAYKYVRVCLYVLIYIYIYMHVLTYVLMYTHMYVFVYYVFMYICMCLCTYIHMYVCTYIHAHNFTFLFTFLAVLALNRITQHCSFLRYTISQSLLVSTFYASDLPNSL